jgi:hypothetical protein
MELQDFAAKVLYQYTNMQASNWKGRPLMFSYVVQYNEVFWKDIQPLIQENKFDPWFTPEVTSLNNTKVNSITNFEWNLHLGDLEYHQQTSFLFPGKKGHTAHFTQF